MDHIVRVMEQSEEGHGRSRHDDYLHRWEWLRESLIRYPIVSWWLFPSQEHHCSKVNLGQTWERHLLGDACSSTVQQSHDPKYNSIRVLEVVVGPHVTSHTAIAFIGALLGRRNNGPHDLDHWYSRFYLHHRYIQVWFWRPLKIIVSKGF